MADWRSPNEAGRTAPSGSYVVFHERPFPTRLDRAFRVGAIVAAVIAAAVIGWWIAYFGTRPPSGFGDYGWVLLGLLIAAAFAYGLVRAFGLMAVGLVQMVRRRQYVIDWQDDAEGPQ